MCKSVGNEFGNKKLKIKLKKPSKSDKQNMRLHGLTHFPRVNSVALVKHQDIVSQVFE